MTDADTDSMKCGSCGESLQEASLFCRHCLDMSPPTMLAEDYRTGNFDRILQACRGLLAGTLHPDECRAVIEEMKILLDRECQSFAGIEIHARVAPEVSLQRRLIAEGLGLFLEGLARISQSFAAKEGIVEGLLLIEDGNDRMNAAMKVIESQESAEQEKLTTFGSAWLGLTGREQKPE